VIFDDRAWGAKLAAALALVVGLGVLSAVRGDSLKPALSRCLAEPQRWEGTRLWIPGGLVAEAGTSDWILSADDRTVRVEGPPPGPRGTSVSVAGTFRASGPALADARASRRPASPWTRRAMEAASLVVALLVLANAARAFRLDPARLRMERRD
jgi:hypothetical protein